MTVRIATPADATLVVTLKNGQRPLMDAIFGSSEPWTEEIALNVINDPASRIYLYNAEGMLYVIRRSPQEEYGVTVCLSQAGNLTQRMTRFRAALREFGVWFTDCIAAGVTECSFTWRDSERSFSRVNGWDKLGQFGTRTVDENGMVTWRVTPEQGQAGLATV